jgi:cobalt-zinc-cadmium resistance protein CzcA
MVVLLLFVFGIGLASFIKLNIEAYPDPVPPLVDVVTQNPGQSAEEIERYITIPLEIQMAGIPHVTRVRTISLFGLSDLKIQFTYDFTYDEAQQWVINRLSQLSPLPNGARRRRFRRTARSARSTATASSVRRATALPI